MTDTTIELTGSQTAFVSRSLILDVLESLAQTEAGHEDWFNDEIDDDLAQAIELATEDLEKARAVMEEHSAFTFLVDRLQAENPKTPRTQVQKAARALVADLDTRHALAVESGAYTRMGLEAPE